MARLANMIRVPAAPEGGRGAHLARTSARRRRRGRGRRQRQRGDPATGGPARGRAGSWGLAAP
eukprot:4476159-Lingulodinium_polyedra.AAC.1